MMPINQDKVIFMSRGDMKRLVNRVEEFDLHLNDYAIISINDTPTEYDEMERLLNGWCYTAVMFKDTEDDDCISPLQAQLILHFIDKNPNKKFIVHCFAGVSRSGAVAKFINEYYDFNQWYLEDYAGYNRRVYNQLHAAAGTSLAAYYNELEKEDR